MIDGVDVSGCFYRSTNGLTNHKEIYCREFTRDCKDNFNCYYKQLQRKEQECEELKKKKEENETFYLREYANKDSECLELQHKLKIATEALKFYSGTFPNGNKNTAKRVLEQIESEEQ